MFQNSGIPSSPEPIFLLLPLPTRPQARSFLQRKIFLARRNILLIARSCDAGSIFVFLRVSFLSSVLRGYLFSSTLAPATVFAFLGYLLTSMRQLPQAV